MVDFLSYAEGLYCHAHAGTLTHAGKIEVGM